MDINQMVDFAYLAVICTGIRYVVGADGVKFGWLLLRTIARWAVGK